jgi:hypothetical protein
MVLEIEGALRAETEPERFGLGGTGVAAGAIAGQEGMGNGKPFGAGRFWPIATSIGLAILT